MPWTANLWLRIRRLFLLKLVGTSAWTTAFFVAYFHLLRHPTRPPFTMPLTGLDHLIPFQPQALFAYLTLWFYVGIAPGLQLKLAELLVYGLWAGALCLAGLACFYFWPTTVPPITFDISSFPGFSMLQGVDATGNACPSMHVAIAIFSALWLDHILREARAPLPLRVANAVWFTLIAWSTVAIKQHVVLDAVAGAALGLVFALASLRWRPGRAAPLNLAIGADIIDQQRSKAASAAVMSTDTAP
jgi:membrane-associated phospholipid phosphatase